MSIRSNKFLIGSKIDLRDMIYYKKLNFSYFLYFSYYLIVNIFLNQSWRSFIRPKQHFLKLYRIDLDYNDIIYKVILNLTEIVKR